MDLLGRKLGMNGGKTFIALIHKMVETVSKAKSIPRLEDLGEELEYCISKFANSIKDIDLRT